MFSAVFSESIIARAKKRGLVQINFYNLRDFAFDKHKTVDDTPYGGGPGMVIKIDVIDRAIASIKSKIQNSSAANQIKILEKSILLSPQGKRFNQVAVKELSALTDIILICGHYEGFDERIREHLIDEEVSLGDFILSGGEIAAMAVVDSITRLLPGALGKDESLTEESFSLKNEKGKPLLEYPLYTRPLEYKGWGVPEVLLSGNHAKIREWRQAQALKRTETKRPDLIH